MFGQTGSDAPDLNEPDRLRSLYAALADLRRGGYVLAYHDRSDGGLFATVAEMAFAGRTGVTIDLSPLADGTMTPAWVLAALFNEELGVVLQTRTDDRARVRAILAGHGLHAAPPRQPNAWTSSA